MAECPPWRFRFPVWAPWRAVLVTRRMQGAFDEALAELAHPFGSHAFVEPIKHRADQPQRDLIAYHDDDDEAAVAASPAAKVEPVEEDDMEEGELEEDAPSTNASAKPAVAAEKKRKRLHLVKSVRLPNWMDLDQESLPYGGPVRALVDTVAKKTTEATMPSKLAAVGGVGELAVQLRTSRPDAPYDQLLSGFTAAAAEQTAKRQARATPGEGYVCNRCGVPGHWMQDCTAERTLLADKERPPVPLPDSKYVCKVCGVAGHWIDRCPQRRSSGAGGASGGGRPGEALCQLTTPDGAAGPASKKPKRLSRPPKGYVCNACHMANDHYLDACPRYKEYKDGAPPASYVCQRCNQAGHWIEHCKVQVQWKSHSAADGRSEAEEELYVSEEAREVGEDIAESLEEEKPEVLSTIQRVCQLMGEEASRQMLVQTWQIEDTGGILTLDGSNRRRTPGGVFLWLVKQKTNDKQKAQIFATRATTATRVEGE